MTNNENNSQNVDENIETPMEDTVGNTAENAVPEPEPAELTLEQQFENLLQEKEELADRFVRQQAEVENFKRRTQKEATENLQYATANIVRSILPAIDNLKRALDAAESASNLDDLLAGVGMVSKQFEEVLTQHAVKKIEAVGEQFDPNRHEALQQTPTADHPPMTIIQELESGYMLHERVIRPSKVIVAQAMPAKTDESE